MSRPEFVLRGPGDQDGDIKFVDRDGKETDLSLVDLLIIMGEASLIAQMVTVNRMPSRRPNADKVVPLVPSHAPYDS